MKTSNLLILAGIVAIALYGYSQGWFSKKATMGPTTSSSRVAADGTVIPDGAETTTQPQMVQVDNTAQGYVLIPVDSNGNVVAPSQASQFIRYTHTGQDCGVQYRNFIYVIRTRPTPHPMPVPPPTPPVV